MTRKLQYEAQIGERGELAPLPGPDVARVRMRLQLLKGKRAWVTVEPERKNRTLRQNSRYWTLTIPCAAEVLSVGRDLPLSKEQTHYILVSAFLGTIDTPLGPVPRHTKTLSTAEFAEFDERIHAHFASIGQPFPEGIA